MGLGDAVGRLAIWCFIAAPAEPKDLSSQWYDVIGRLLQSFSEVIAVLVGAGLAMVLSRREYKRQRRASMDDRTLDAAARLVETVDGLTGQAGVVGELCGRLLAANEVEGPSLRALRTDALMAEVRGKSAEVLASVREFRTAVLRYQLLAGESSATNMALGLGGEVTHLLQELDTCDATEVPAKGMQLADRLGLLGASLVAVESELRTHVRP